MEADWEFELGQEAPIIDACWPGFVDLQRVPERVCDLAEAAQLPALAEALLRLNAAHSPVWTSKCDFWPNLARGEFDADELDAPAGSAAHAMGCYIDLLPKGDRQWPIPAMAAASCKDACDLLRAVPLRCCRADLVIRRAFITPDQMDLGITGYLTACGPTAAEARAVLEAALEAFTDALCRHSKLQ